MMGKNYGIVAEALANYRELNLLVGRTKSIEEARSILLSQGHDAAPIGKSEIGRGFIIRYKNIDTVVYEYNGYIVADPYIDIYDGNEQIMEAMYIKDLEDGIYEGIYS